MGFFNKLFNNQNIKELEQLNLSLIKKLSYLQKELDEKNSLIDSISSKKTESKSDYSKQWQIMEKNLRNLQDENRILKENLLKMDKIIPSEQWKYSFLVDVKTFFSAAKYTKLRVIFEEKNIIFLKDIQDSMFEEFFGNERFAKDAHIRFSNYKKGKIDWDIKTYLIKGDKVSKIFSKHRKFLNILSENNIEFMIDLENFDFQKLKKFGFNKKEIEYLNSIYETYISERKIS